MTVSFPVGRAVMRDRLARLVERLLPWYDPQREAERDRRVMATVHRAENVSRRIREEYQRADDRMAGHG